MRPEDNITDPTGDEPVGESPELSAQDLPEDPGQNPESVESEAAEHAAEEVEGDLAQLAEKAGKADEYLDLARRTQADFENYRKRASRDAALAEERGVAKLARELVGALDNFDLALAAIAALPDDDPAHQVARGFGLVRDDLVAGLARCGVTIERPAGEVFDPERHEAIAKIQVDGAEPNTVVEVHQAGYLLGSNVIRAARVSVAG